ncbi:CinA family nicotinamide mononucleotide deamidase-related protein [bacterium]|nr:CinA family nicotinamide mononucleotide deamidase-related protein [bacterium]
MHIKGIFIGNELCDGRILNRNQQYLAQHLYNAGYYLTQSLTIDDNVEPLVHALKLAITQNDVLVLTGGLGPTEDDRTRDAVSLATDAPLIENKNALAAISAYFMQTKRDMPKANKKQALFPQGAVLIDNHHGTAPGFYLQVGSCHLFVCPGVPKEFHPMLHDVIVPKLHQLFPQERIHRDITCFKCVGISESACADRLASLYPLATGLSISYQAKPHEIFIQLYCEPDAPKQVIQQIKNSMRTALADVCYSNDPDATLASVIIDLCKSKGLTLSLAESCTGGGVSSALVSVPGASEVLDVGLVTYSNQAKTQWLDIPESLLEKHGAVSEETARDMATQLRQHTGTDIAGSISGIAGPTGGTSEKPVGTVCFAVSSDAGTLTQTRYIHGNRSLIQHKATLILLDMIFKRITT